MSVKFEALGSWDEALKGSPVLRERGAGVDGAACLVGSVQRARAERSQLVRFQQRFSSNVSVRHCGVSLVARGGLADLGVRVGEDGKRRASFSGVQRCGSRVLCVECSRRASLKSEAELSAAVDSHLGRGGVLYFGTFTLASREVRTPRFVSVDGEWRGSEAFAVLRKRLKDAVTPVTVANRRMRDGFKEWLAVRSGVRDSFAGWDMTRRLDAVKAGLGRVFGGGSWANDRGRFGIDGVHYKVEIRVTPSSGGWGHVSHNVHVHFLLFAETRLSSDDETVLWGKLMRRWTRSAAKGGFTAAEAGQDFGWFEVRSEDAAARISKYLNKQVFRHVWDEQGRKRRDGVVSYDYWQALRAASGGDADALVWWRNFEGAVKGRKLAGWSQGLRERLGVTEVVEANRATAEQGSSFTRLVSLPQESWETLSSRPDSLTVLLNLAENAPDGLSAVISQLEAWGVSFFRCEPVVVSPPLSLKSGDDLVSAAHV